MAGWLTLEELLYIHEAQLTAFGGAGGILDRGLLEAALARPSAVLEGHEPHRTAFARAAALMEAVIQNHGFVDGNKRTGATATIIWLEREGYVLESSDDELIRVAVRVADHSCPLAELSTWIERRSRPRNA